MSARLKAELQTLNPPAGETAKRPQERAFTVLELLLAVSLMTLIVIVLFSVFNQTQRALLGNVAQTDVLQSGRAAMDLMVNDLQQCQPAGLNPGPNLWCRLNANAKPLIQPLPGGGARTNFLDEFFFLTRSNGTWLGNGYFVAPSTDPTQPLGIAAAGTLYRFSAPNLPPFGTPTNRLTTNLLVQLQLQFLQTETSLLAARSNALAVADGVVHLRLLPFDFLGRPMVVTNGIYYPTVKVYEYYPGFDMRAPPRVPNVSILPDSVATETRFTFTSNALPAYLELELGILEPQAADQLKGMPNAAAAHNYLTNQAGKVHLFRRRIPIATGTLR